MKIIHCADLHFGAKMGTSMPKDLSRKRRLEIIDSFHQLTNYAKNSNVKIILISGDMFNDDKIDSIKKVIAIIKECKMINFYYLRGNHDELVNFDKPDNLIILENELIKYNDNGVVISGLSDNQLSIDDDFFDPSYFNILLMHGNIVNYNSLNKQDINLCNLLNKSINYLALGHIHEYKKIDFEPNHYAFYPGCLEGCGFDETGKKGFLLLEVNNNKLESVEFIANSLREYVNIDIDITNIELVKDYVVEYLKNQNINNNFIVRVNLFGEYTKDTIKELDLIDEYIKSNYFFGKVIDSSTLKIDLDYYINDISLEGCFVRLVNESQTLTEKEKEEISFLGINSLTKGESL